MEKLGTIFDTIFNGAVNILIIQFGIIFEEIFDGIFNGACVNVYTLFVEIFGAVYTLIIQMIPKNYKIYLQQL